MFGKRRPESALLEPPEPVLEIPPLEPESEPVLIPVMERAKAEVSAFELTGDPKDLGNRISQLMTEQRSLLGVEMQAKLLLGERINALKQEKLAITAYEKLPGEKRRVSNEVLAWRKKEPLIVSGYPIPLPELALFSIDHPTLRFSSSHRGHGSFEPGLPSGFHQYYQDLRDQVVRPSQDSFGYVVTSTLTATFSGVIPADTRQKIAEVRSSEVFSDIRMLAEAEWAYDEVPEPLYADPIVVGIIGEEMWVIDIFDPTPIEEYIAREFIT